MDAGPLLGVALESRVHQLHYRYIAVKLSLHYRYITLKAGCSSYITVTLPLHCRYVAVTLPLHHLEGRVLQAHQPEANTHAVVGAAADGAVRGEAARLRPYAIEAVAVGNRGCHRR